MLHNFNTNNFMENKISNQQLPEPLMLDGIFNPMQKLPASAEEIMLECDDAYHYFPGKPDLYVSLKEWLRANTDVDVDAPPVEELQAVIALKVGQQTTVCTSKIRRVK